MWCKHAVMDANHDHVHVCMCYIFIYTYICMCSHRLDESQEQAWVWCIWCDTCSKAGLCIHAVTRRAKMGSGQPAKGSNWNKSCTKYWAQSSNKVTSLIGQEKKHTQTHIHTRILTHVATTVQKQFQLYIEPFRRRKSVWFHDNKSFCKFSYLFLGTAPLFACLPLKSPLSNNHSLSHGKRLQYSTAHSSLNISR